MDVLGDAGGRWRPLVTFQGGKHPSWMHHLAGLESPAGVELVMPVMVQVLQLIIAQPFETEKENG
jgi:hypothetical protein